MREDAVMILAAVLFGGLAVGMTVGTGIVWRVFLLILEDLLH